MAHGQPDFGMYAAKTIVGSLADMAELAIRLGSIVNYDRRGDVIFLEDYDTPISKFDDISAAGGAVALDSEIVLSGSQALKFTTGAIAAQDATARHIVPVFGGGRHGLKTSISLFELTDYVSYYRIWGAIEDGAFQHFFGVRINPNAHTIEYNDETNNWVPFETALYLDTDYLLCFHNIKFVVDLSTGYYVRLMINDVEWDMSAYRYWRDPLLTIATLLVSFMIYNGTNDVLTCWQDNFIYTINEP